MEIGSQEHGNDNVLPATMCSPVCCLNTYKRHSWRHHEPPSMIQWNGSNDELTSTIFSTCVVNAFLRHQRETQHPFPPSVDRRSAAQITRKPLQRSHLDHLDKLILNLQHGHVDSKPPR